MIHNALNGWIIILIISSFYRVFGEVLGQGLVLLEGAIHTTHKRLMSPSFNKASIKSKS